MSYIKIFLAVLVSVCYFSSADAQGFLKRIERSIDASTQKKTTTDPAANSTGNNSNTSNSSNSNSGGEGLISTPPDVKENLSSAEIAFKNAKYSDARYAVQQAMLGVELEIGHQILKSLPATIDNLKRDTTKDMVASSGWGWSGLTMNTKYQTGKKEFNLTIANNSAWMNAINLYMNNMGYAQSGNDRQKMKQIMIKGNRSIIEYDAHSGYKISIPMGQTSLMILEGVNFETEKEMTAAANEIDIDGIKEKLGEK